MYDELHNIKLYYAVKDFFEVDEVHGQEYIVNNVIPLQWLQTFIGFHSSLCPIISYLIIVPMSLDKSVRWIHYYVYSMICGLQVISHHPGQKTPSSQSLNQGKIWPTLGTTGLLLLLAVFVKHSSDSWIVDLCGF